MADLRISLLGTPSILVENQPFDTDRRKAIALLAYLAVTGKTQPRQQLAAFFWPDYDRDSAFAYLRRTLYELNKGLGSGWLLTDRESAGFDTSTGALVDTQVFERELAASSSSDDPLPHLETAVAQYKGEFMAGFFLQDTEPFEDWLRLQRENHRRNFATVLERLVAIYEQRAAWEPALKHGLAWVGLDDLNEAAYRAVMRIYASMGDRSSAIRQFEICAQKLREDLKVKPQPETTALYELIRTGSFEGAKRPVELLKAEGKNVTNLHLPVLTTPFIGRRSEIEQVKELILNPNNRLVTLFGPGGAGKTRLSIQAASEVCDHFPDGVWFTSLVAVQTTEGILPAIAKALNFSFHREEETHRKQILEFIAEKKLLLILDNIDKLVSAKTASMLVEILTSSESLKLLVTSRERLNVQAEQVFPVPGMHMPTPAEAAEWTDPEKQAAPFSAMQLFINKARRVKPDFMLNHENATAVAEICQLVSGMPLGLELAASWMELLPPEEIKDEMRRSLDFLETDQPDVPDRQRSIRAVFDYSWKMLNDSEREIFLALSVFNGSFTREAAQQVSGAALRGLLSLANKSWLQQVQGGRFHLHPLLQHYGLDLLRQNDQKWKNACERHAHYYAQFVVEQTRRLHSAEQLAALEDLSEEFDTNVKAAWEWLAAEGCWTEIREKMVLGCFEFGTMRWRSDDFIVLLRNTRLKLERLEGREELLTRAIIGIAEINFEEMWAFMENRPADRTAALWNTVEENNLADLMGIWYVLLGKIYAMQNPSRQVEDKIEKAIERIREQKDPWLLGMALLLQASLWGGFPKGESLGKTDQYMQEALKIFKELGTIYELSEILRSMAEIAIKKKLPMDEIIDLYRQAQEFSTKLNDLVGIGMIYFSMGNLFFQRGRAEEGFMTLHNMRQVFEQIGNQRMVGMSLSWESIWATRYSNFEHALETRQRDMEHSQKYWSQAVYFWNLLEMGEVYRIFGNQKKALEYFETAHENFQRINMKLGLGHYQRGLGDIAMLECRYTDALKHYQDYQYFAEQDNHEWSIAQAFLKQAWAYAHLGEVEKSRRNNYACLKRLQNADEVAMELMALLCEARCLAEEGNIEPAVALAAFVSGHPITWNETRTLAKALLASHTHKLDSQALRKAYSRFQGRDVRELTSVWLTDYERQGAR